MAAIGVGLLWMGYWWGLAGVSMVKGWNNSPLQLANPVRVVTFTTACYTGSGVFPTGNPADSGPCAAGQGGGTWQRTNIKAGQVAGVPKQVGHTPFPAH